MLLPAVISHLSVGEYAVDEEAFQSTMTYIFKFIEKVTGIYCALCPFAHDL